MVVLPRLAGLPAAPLELYDATLAVLSPTGQVQLDYRVMPAQSGAQTGFVPTIAAHVLHLDPLTLNPLGRQHNGFFKKGVQGHLVASPDAGLVFLARGKKQVCIAQADVSGGSDVPRASTTGESFAVWEQFTQPMSVADAVRQSDGDSVVIPFVDVVSADAVAPEQSPGRVGKGERSCIRLVLEDVSGEPSAFLLLVADAGYSDPGFFAMHKLIAELRGLQRRLRDEVTADVWARHGAPSALTGDRLAEAVAEADDTWLLWRQAQGMTDVRFCGCSSKELERFFADMATVMPTYWEIPSVRGVLERECHGVRGALPEDS